jgi:hypothetical protein
MRALATIHSYQDLQQALRRRADELDVANETLDSVCGFTDRYCSKVLGLHPKRALGRISLAALLGGLGAVLVLYEDPAALQRVRSQLVKRKKNGPGRQIEPVGEQPSPVR